MQICQDMLVKILLYINTIPILSFCTKSLTRGKFHAWNVQALHIYICPIIIPYFHYWEHWLNCTANSIFFIFQVKMASKTSIMIVGIIVLLSVFLTPVRSIG